MPLPSDGLWTVRFAVTRRCPVDADVGSGLQDQRSMRSGAAGDGSSISASGSVDGVSADAPRSDESEPSPVMAESSLTGKGDYIVSDPTDWVTVRIGGSLDMLTNVASVKNVVNPAFGEVKVRRCCWWLANENLRLTN